MSTPCYNIFNNEDILNYKELIETMDELPFKIG